MTLTATPPTGEVNLEINQGSTWSQQLLIVDSLDVALDFTGCTARMMVRKFKDDTTVLVSLTTENGGITLQAGNSGTVTPNVILALSATATAALAAAANRYDLEIVYGDGTVWRPIEGKFVVSREVTR